MYYEWACFFICLPRRMTFKEDGWKRGKSLQLRLTPSWTWGGWVWIWLWLPYSYFIWTRRFSFAKRWCDKHCRRKTQTHAYWNKKYPWWIHHNYVLLWIKKDGVGRSKYTLKTFKWMDVVFTKVFVHLSSNWMNNTSRGEKCVNFFTLLLLPV